MLRSEALCRIVPRAENTELSELFPIYFIKRYISDHRDARFLIDANNTILVFGRAFLA